MRKDALAVTVSTLVMGIFGAFLRWLQNRTIFEEETGLAIRGATISKVYIVYSILALVVMIGVVVFRLRRCDKPGTAGEALRPFTVLPAVLGWAGFAVFAVCGVALMFSAGGSVYPGLQRVFGACAILGGACFPFLPGRRDGEPQSLGRTGSAFAALFFCLWLVYSYLVNAQNPVLWAYAPEILAAAASTLAFYYIAGWFYDCVKPNAALVMVQTAAFLNICTLPDSRRRSLTAMLAVSAAMLLTLEFLLIENMTDKAE